MHKQSRNVRVYFVLFLALLVLLTGCKGAQQVSASTPEPSATQSSTPEPTASLTPSPTPSPTPSLLPEPNVAAFSIGENEVGGYHSEFFRFGFLVPAKFTVYDRLAVDDMNGIDSSQMSPEEVRKKLVRQLRMDHTIFDFISLYEDSKGYAIVMVIDYSKLDEQDYSEEKVLNKLESSMVSANGEDRYENVELATIEFGGVEHPVYLFDITSGTEHAKGALFAIQRGSTFAIVRVKTPYKGEVNFLLGSLYSLD